MTKAEIIAKYAIHEGDTRRRGLQNYLKKTDIERYRKICAELGLRK